MVLGRLSSSYWFHSPTGPLKSFMIGETFYVEFTTLASKCAPTGQGWRKPRPHWNHMLLWSNTVALISPTSKPLCIENKTPEKCGWLNLFLRNLFPGLQCDRSTERQAAMLTTTSSLAEFLLIYLQMSNRI